MTLFSSLKASTLGLKAQGTKMGAISDNIANVNTVGYKRTDVQFATFVTEALTETKFTPGGVTARPRQVVDLSGQIMATSTTTDLSVGGRGMFVVTEDATFNAAESDDGLAYTRAGSFRADADGYLENSAGYYLQGWAVNKDGNVTPDADNPDLIKTNPTSFDLEPVNVNRIATIAEQTTELKTRMNLPAEYTSTSQITADNSYLQASTAAVQQVIAEAINYGMVQTGGALTTDDNTGGNATYYNLENNTGVVEAIDALNTAISAGSSLNTAIDNMVTDAAAAAVAADGTLNQDTVEDTLRKSLNEALTTLNIAGQAYRAAYQAAVDYGETAADANDLAGQIYNQVWGAASTLGDGTVASGTDFSSGIIGTYANASTIVTTGMAASAVSGSAEETRITNRLTAEVDRMLTVGANSKESFYQAIGVNKDANLGTVSADASSSAPFTSSYTVFDAEGQAHQVQMDWYKVEQIDTYDLSTDTADYTSEPNTWAVRLNSSSITDTESGLQDFTSNRVETLASDPDVEVPRFVAYKPSHSNVNYTNDDSSGDDMITNANDVVQTDTLFIRFNGDGSLEGLYTDPDFSEKSRVVARSAEADDPLKMVSIAVGRVVPDQVSGSGLFVNTDGTSTADKGTDLVRPVESGDTDFTDTTADALDDVSPFDAQGAYALVFDWDVGRPTNVATSNTAGSGTDAEYSGTGLDGLTQFDSGEATAALETFFVSQDGLRAGTVTGVTVDEEGLMTAIYDNGAQRSIYKIPLATFTNYNGLINESGNVYRESEESGDMQINFATQGTAGTIIGSTLEQANVELGDEFTDMIVTQQAFTANTRAITTTDEMLTDINNMVR